MQAKATEACLKEFRVAFDLCMIQLDDGQTLPVAFPKLPPSGEDQWRGYVYSSEDQSWKHVRSTLDEAAIRSQTGISGWANCLNSCIFL
jgi:hypothetical protein